MNLPHQRHTIRHLLLASIFSLTPAAWSATYYVSTTGNDANSGSSSAPFATLQKGVNTAQAGDSVFVNSGTYRNQTVSFPRSGTSASPITLKATPGATVFVKGSNLVTGWTLDSGAVY